MTVKYLVAEKVEEQYHFIVLIDDTKYVESGEQDPAYVREYYWSSTPPDGQTTQQYLDNIKNEIQALADWELSQMQQQQQPTDPEPLAGF